MLLRFRCNFVRLKDDSQLLNVPQTCASHGPSYRAHPSTLPALSSGGLENERTIPRATFRRGQLSLQSNEIFGRTNPIPERSRRRDNCAQALVAGPAVFPLYFQRAVSTRAGSERNCANKGREHPAVPVHDRSRLRG